MEHILSFISCTDYSYEILIAEYLIALNFQKRSHFWPRALFSLICCSGMNFLLLNIADLFPYGTVPGMVFAGWRYFILFSVTIFFLCFIYDESIWSSAFCASAAQAAQHLAHRLRDLIEATTGFRDNQTAHLLITVMVFSATYAVVYFLFFHKLRDKEFPNINNRNMICTITACVVICIFIGAHGVFDSVLNYVIYDLSMTMTCFFILCYQFGFLDSSYKDMEYESLQRMFQQAKKHYDLTCENIEIINIKCHDIRKQIRFLGREAKLDEGALKEITSAVNIYDSGIDTGNKVLDVILTDKSMICGKNKIRFGCMIDGEALPFMSSMDMVSLFGNLIDNAIEAVMKLEEIEKAIINLNIRTLNGAVFVHCENYFNSSLNMEDGIPRTTKQDQNYHGFGIKSIRFIVEKYDGTMTIVPEDDVFNVNIIIPIPTEH